MAETVYQSAGVNTRIIDLSNPQNVVPSGVPAAIVGTSQKGQAFVPTTVANISEYTSLFGLPTFDHVNGPLATIEWLRNAQAATYTRILGVGTGLARTDSGKVAAAGFVVGSRQPDSAGALAVNPYAVTLGVPGRVHFLGALMSATAGSAIFSDAGLQPNETAVPIVRGVLFAASGVVPMLSASWGPVGFSARPSPTVAASFATFSGSISGSVDLTDGKQEFVLLLNGHKGTLEQYPNLITASFDSSASNYFGDVLNRDPYKLQEAGYVLYTAYDVNTNFAVVTGTGLLSDNYSAGDASNTVAAGKEPSAFLTYGASSYNSGSTTIPCFESFEDRFQAARTPWVVSQKFGGSPVNLFQIELIDDGEEPTAKVKFSIENLTRSPSPTYKYGTFDLIVRKFDDNDSNKIAYEQYRGLNLDPNSPRYIAKIVGDKKIFFNFDVNESAQRMVEDGEYLGPSAYIRVKMAEDVKNKNVNAEALPVGFRGISHLVTSGTAPLTNITGPGYNVATILNKAVQPPIQMRLNIARGSVPTQSVNRSLYWGVQFEYQSDIGEINSDLSVEPSIAEYTKFFPTFQEQWMNAYAGENEGATDTAANGIVDADRFCHNAFSLEKIKIRYNSSTSIADPSTAASWVYVRNGIIVPDGGTFTRAFTVGDLDDPSVRAMAKFSFFAQSGFDGSNIFNKKAKFFQNQAVIEEVNNSSRGLTNGPTVKAYSKALDIMSNTTDVFFKILSVPGIRAAYITDKAIQTIQESRLDSVFILDVEEYDTNASLVTGSSQIVSVSNTADNFRNRGLDTSYAAAYFPDVNMRHPFNQTIVRVPPSVAVLGAIARSDAMSHEWFAVAGYERGPLVNADSANTSLNLNNRNYLQSANINPILSFPGSGGLIIWGQKTLQANASSTDRLSVRRLLIEIRRRVKNVSTQIIFEPNRAATLQKFEKLVAPILSAIQSQQGIDRFGIKIDADTTTQADIENNTIRGKIMVRPTRTLEFAEIDFSVNNAGVNL